MNDSDTTPNASDPGSVTLPEMVIPLRVDASKLEVYLETLKNSSMMKGAVSGPTSANDSPSDGMYTEPPQKQDASSTAQLESLVANLVLTMTKIETLVAEINSNVVALTVKIDG